MTPAARVAAAIEVLDRVAAGTPAEQALTTWARGNRFAGAKDRAAIRDHVFDALRRRESLALLGGGQSGRALMIGALRSAGTDPALLFNGEGYAPPALTEAETAHRPPPIANWPRSSRLDYPAWLDAELTRSLGDGFEAAMESLRQRAPVFLRVNLAKATPAEAVAALAENQIAATPHPLAATALVATRNARAIRRSRAYGEGLVELQDAASQAVVEALGRPGGGGRALDYCAGGGGKSLALAALGWRVMAHDRDPRRMSDLSPRAARAGAEIPLVEPEALPAMPPFDLVLADAPCSGSGAWRRQADARWRLTPERLKELMALQDDILDVASGLVAPSGRFAYVTCSLLRAENEDRIAAFLARNPDWRLAFDRRFSPVQGGDGFYVAALEKRV